MRLRFTIRDLLWLTVVAVLAVVVWISRGEVRKAHDERDQIKAEAEGWAHEFFAPMEMLRRQQGEKPGTTPLPPWIVRERGEETAAKDKK